MRAILLLIVAGPWVAASGPAGAQAARTFVSSSGDDAANCSRQAPCRSFAAAITKTSAGGEINTLDPGGYGPVTITKSISIVSGLGEAGVLVPSGGTGITINAGPGDQVNLRGLAIEGAGVGTNGIQFNAGGSLTVTNSVVRNVARAAIEIAPTADSRFTITDTLLADTAGYGLYVHPIGSFGSTRGHVERVTASHNAYGFYFDGNNPQHYGQVYVTFVRSAASQNTKGDGYGVYGNRALVYVLASVMSGNTVGYFADNATMYLGSSLIGGNKTGVKCNGTTSSYGDNTIDFNDQGDGWSCLTTRAKH